MRVYNRYILIVTILLLLTTVILIGIGQTSLDVYYSTYVLEALVVTELYAYLNSKARRGLNVVSLMLLSGFLIIVVLKVVVVLL
jgi:hypothetical protein